MRFTFDGEDRLKESKSPREMAARIGSTFGSSGAIRLVMMMEKPTQKWSQRWKSRAAEALERFK